jgi:1,2-diacylglycerol 3-beta-galactosyltransferase
MKIPHILFLFSDTGGGHRSACEAIIEALDLEFPNRLTMEMVDVFREYAPPPLNRVPEFYPPLIKMQDVWKLGYHISDGRSGQRFVSNMFWPYVRRASHRLVHDRPADLYVSVHPLLNTPVRRVTQKIGVPFMTVITDMVSVHAFWFDRQADLIITPTEVARQRGLELGINPEQLRVIGMPVADKFCRPPTDRQMLRERLGWQAEIPVIILVGGGEGMGPLGETAQAINEARLPIQLVIIAGRNRKLKADLENRDWNMPVYIYGFVTEMQDFMQAGDILVTKAGPGTISEAFISGLPIILYSRLPGQEDGNVTYVVNEGAGIWAPQPALVVNALREWLDHPEERQEAVDVCKRLARPQASRQIARLLAEKVGVERKQV